MLSNKPNWILLKECAEKLTQEGQVPFTRKQLINCVLQQYPDRGEGSINPMIQCMTVNLKGGAPSGVGKGIFYSVGRGLFELYDAKKHGDIDKPMTSNQRMTTSYVTRGRFNIISSNKNELLENIQDYYKKTENIGNEFGGPSVYFHIECIKEGKKNYLSDRHIEMLYATLASWGMHRMGDPEKTKAKLVDFGDFKQSINSFGKELNILKQTRLVDIEKNKGIIKNIFTNLKISISDSILVANSKTMHHLLWNLIPPIDRQYTIRFFLHNKETFRGSNGKYKGIMLPSDKERQFELFWDIALEVKSIIESPEFNSLNVEIKTDFLNTSKPKIVDNLIMVFVKNN